MKEEGEGEEEVVDLMVSLEEYMKLLLFAKLRVVAVEVVVVYR